MVEGETEEGPREGIEKVGIVEGGSRWVAVYMGEYVVIQGGWKSLTLRSNRASRCRVLLVGPQIRPSYDMA